MQATTEVPLLDGEPLKMINDDIKTISDYYDDRVETEWFRLDRYKMEHAITKKVITEVLGSNKCSICDIGGGPGRYAFWLNEDGHKVTLLDLSPKNIDYAKAKEKELTTKLEYIDVANALDLSMIKDNSFDVVLLMGPLYHLTSYEDRMKAVSEAYRILKPGGTIIASAISKIERLRYLASQDIEYPSRNMDEMKAILSQGKTTGGMDVGLDKKSFTIAHFTTVNALTLLMEESGFNKVKVQGIEVVNGRQFDGVNECSKNAFDCWVEINYELGQDEAFQNASDHLIYVGKKSGN